MGGRSKFSFPLPRKHSRETKPARYAESPNVASSGLSKAQRILGTEGDINIDAPTWDDLSTRGDGQSWRSRPRSSGMSISISESTQSTYDSESSELWEQESGVFPRPQGHNKAATQLGQYYNDDGATDLSSVGQRLRREDSSSTLRSYYDRLKSPLSISQQTSESSARDLALRKGFPPVLNFQRSPLLQVESVDPFQQQFVDSNSGGLSQEGLSRKKPPKLDLSMLFAKSRRNGEDSTTSPSSILTNQSGNHPQRKLTKAPSKESLQSNQHSSRSTQTTHLKQCKVEETKGSRRPDRSNSRQRDTQGTLYQLYDHYEHLPTRSARMSQIPESRVPDAIEVPPRKHKQHPDPMPTPPKSRESRSNQESHSTPGRESFSWKNVRASMVSPQCEASSAASISSRNSKTSRHTSVSIFSNSDLRQNSVLSLSSDSEDDLDDDTASSSVILPTRSLMRDQVPQKAPEAQRQYQSSKPSESVDAPQALKLPSRTPKTHFPRKVSRASSQFLPIPEIEPTNSRLSGPWSPPKGVDSRSSMIRDKRSSSKRTSSIASATSQQPTPPLSPNSMESRRSSTPSSRFMAVTKQEEALLEALRQKRANMREKIIKEHERIKTPAEAKSDRSRSRFSETSSVGTIRENSNNNKEEILLYLGTPIANMQPIHGSEPSPDLSDFLSFGSDDGSTPRTNRLQSSRDRPKPDSSVSPSLDRRGSNFSPLTPPTAARISAVGGSASGFREARTKKRNASSGVRFVDDAKFDADRAQQDFLLDDNESGTVWGLSG